MSSSSFFFVVLEKPPIGTGITGYRKYQSKHPLSFFKIIN
jgi:hypothetical protein